MSPPPDLLLELEVLVLLELELLVLEVDVLEVLVLELDVLELLVLLLLELDRQGVSETKAPTKAGMYRYRQCPLQSIIGMQRKSSGWEEELDVLVFELLDVPLDVSELLDVPELDVLELLVLVWLDVLLLDEVLLLELDEETINGLQTEQHSSKMNSA